MNHEIWMFIRNIAVTALVIAPFLLILKWADYIYKKRALETVLGYPAVIQNILKDPKSCTETQGISPVKYLRQGLIWGIAAYILIIGPAFFKSFIKEKSTDYGFFFGFSVFLVAIIGALIIRDIFRVAPRRTVYRIKAAVCASDRNGNIYFAFYDFLNEKFSAGKIFVPVTHRSELLKEQFVDILAVKRNGKLKALDIATTKEFKK